MGENNLNPQAQEMNERLKTLHPQLFGMLSRRGREIFFPKKGILAQSAEAKGAEINATIGVALENDGSPMRLNCVDINIPISPEDAYLYAPSYGKKELRIRWKEMLFEKNNSLKHCSLPVVTNALTHALNRLGYLFVDDGDEIISPDLYWGNYRLIFTNAFGGKLVTFPLFEGKGFNLSGFREKLMSEGEKKIVILNLPNNPTGYTPTNKEAVQILEIIKEAAEAGKKIVAINDDAYFGLVYEDDIFPESLAAHMSEMHENVLGIKVDGATKEDYAWGLRVGFITYTIKGGNEDIYQIMEEKTAGAVRGNVSNVSNLSQSIMLEAYNSPNYMNEKLEKYDVLKERFLKVKDILSEREADFSEYFEELPYNSGYFMCVKLKNIDAEELRQKLIKDYSTGVISIGDDVIRVAFSSLPASVISKLFDNLYKACRDLSGSIS